MSRLRIAVVGAGHLGRIHARLVQQLDECRLVAVVDPVHSAREQVAESAGCKTLDHYESLDGLVDAAIVATPTRYHHGVANWLLGEGIHVLVEKPITATLPEANDLIRTAAETNTVLQVGHVERFNPVWTTAAPFIERPQFIEAVRSGGYSFRSTDVSIVHDLMIHDIDLILSLVHSPVMDVEAIGATVFSKHSDLAHARLRFANGCVANLNASRVSDSVERTMKLFGPTAFASVDFAAGNATLIRPHTSVLRGQVDLTDCPLDQRAAVQATMFDELLCKKELEVPAGNAILEELRAFSASIRKGSPVRVTGQHAKDALDVAERIVQAIKVHRVQHDQASFDLTAPLSARAVPVQTPRGRAA